jgi:hypothetical protein
MASSTEIESLIYNICNGLQGWLMFNQFADRSPNLSEHSLYKPITEIAANNNWSVDVQRPIQKISGNPKTVDFIFQKKNRGFSYKNGRNYSARWPNIACSLEVKFVHKAGKFSGKIHDDAVKLASATEADLKLANIKIYEQYILVVGPHKEISTIASKKRRIVERVRFYKELKMALKQTNCEFRKRGLRVTGPTLQRQPYSVIALRYQNYWKSIR